MKKLLVTPMFKSIMAAAVLALTFGRPPSLVAEDSAVSKGRSIAAKMIYRKDGFSAYNYAVLVSCDFKNQGGSFSCASSPRKKVFESIQQDTGDDGEDSISLSLLVSPAAEKGTAFLQKDYEHARKDSEQWLYLPALKKLKRVVSQSKNAPKTGTLFGSEIAYEDIEKVRLLDYVFRYQGEAEIAGRTSFKLESIPTQRRRAKTSYGRFVTWVDQKTYIPLKTEMYDRSGKLVKTMLNQKLEQQSGVWYAARTIMVNHKRSRMSMILNQTTKVNKTIPAVLFQPRALRDRSLRESKMNLVR